MTEGKKYIFLDVINIYLYRGVTMNLSRGEGGLKNVVSNNTHINYTNTSIL